MPCVRQMRGQWSRLLPPKHSRPNAGTLLPALLGDVREEQVVLCLTSRSERSHTRPPRRVHIMKIRHLTLLLASGTIIAAGVVSVFLAINNPSPAGNPSEASRKVKYYKSTMMLGEISDVSRKDSMGMDMVPVYEGEETSGAIAIDASTVQKMGLRTAEVRRGPLLKNIRTVGKVEFNETAVSDVNVREAGWIENLYVNSVGKLVHRGEPLFDFFSPELMVAQQEYVLTQGQGEARAGQALMKLKNLGVPEMEIESLRKTNEAKRILRVDAPRDGVVVEKNAIEGQRVEAGERLYRIADLGTVWVMADIFESDLPFLQIGQEALVRLSYLPDRMFKGRVTYIYPTVDEQTRTIRVRMEFFNPGFFLKPGMYATAEIQSQIASDAILVPESAVLRSGEANTVFVALDEGRFEPRTVSIGSRGADHSYQVFEGLSEGDKVVISGQFLLDSESQLREAIQKMLGSGKETQVHAEHSPAKLADSKQPNVPASSPAYACPMPEHVSILYDHAGKCPICSMTLVPIEASARPLPTPAQSPNPHAGHAQSSN